MSQHAISLIKSAAHDIFELPEPFLDLKLKQEIPIENDWDNFNTALCKLLTDDGCMTLEGELDPFWEANKAFADMIEYLDTKCNYTPTSSPS
jgi:hypothetical protein